MLFQDLAFINNQRLTIVTQMVALYHFYKYSRRIFLLYKIYDHEKGNNPV